MRFAERFYCERTEKYSVIAGVRGTEIHVELHLEDAERARLSALPHEWHIVEYRAALEPLLAQAEAEVRRRWAERKRRLRNG